MTVTIVILAVAAFLTSALSGMLGMGGGMLLLALLFSFLTHAETIPTHAVVQMASNGTRVFAFISHVDWRAVRRFLIGLLPGSAIGGFLLWAIGIPEKSDPYLKCAVGTYILVATFIPKPRQAAGRSRWWDFPLLGLVAGTASLTLGAIGPLIAPMFARRDFLKERLVATKAVCQLSCHVLKIPAFVWLRQLDLPSLTGLALVMVVMVIPGTLIGKRMLGHVSDRAFRLLYRYALLVAGAKVLLIDGVARIAGWI